MSTMTSRTSCSRSTQAEVVTSPATMATPVLTRVSQATRACLSWVMMASSTASEIWSAILSGWPSDTDSEVNREYSLIEWFLNYQGVGARRPVETAVSLLDMPPLSVGSAR